MPEQPKLFADGPPRYDPTRPDTHCRICGTLYIYDKHGGARHQRGDGRKCEELMRDRARRFYGRT